MKLKDIDYFSKLEHQSPELFELAQKVVNVSETNIQDKIEIQRRMKLLTRTNGVEHIRQCSNFVAEIGTFNDLIDQGTKPHWVPESNIPMPDIQYTLNDVSCPVEVKHLNSPREEHDALLSGKLYSGYVDKEYDMGIQKKITDFIDDARKKFACYYKEVNKMENCDGTLYLFFSKSIDASLLDSTGRGLAMEKRIKSLCDPLVGDDIKLKIVDIDKFYLTANNPKTSQPSATGSSLCS